MFNVPGGTAKTLATASVFRWWKPGSELGNQLEELPRTTESSPLGGSPRGAAFCTPFSYLWGIFRGVNYRGRVIASQNKEETNWVWGCCSRWGAGEEGIGRGSGGGGGGYHSFFASFLSWRVISCLLLSTQLSPSRQRCTTSEPTAWGASPSHSLFSLISIPTRSDLPYDLFMAIKLWNVHQSDCGITPFLTLDSGKETPAESRLTSS